MASSDVRYNVFRVQFLYKNVLKTKTIPLSIMFPLETLS
jgi:hypothetical protein